MRIICPQCNHTVTFETVLTKREIEVCLLIAQGLNNIEISEKMWVSEKTVKNHISHTYKKLAIKNRFGVLKYLIQNNFIRHTEIGCQNIVK